MHAMACRQFQVLARNASSIRGYLSYPFLSLKYGTGFICILGLTYCVHGATLQEVLVERHMASIFGL